jgi:hypothetical protein
METEFDSALIDTSKHMGEPWSHLIARLDEEALRIWDVLVGVSDDDVVLTTGEVELFYLLDDEHKLKVMKHWRATRRPAEAMDNYWNFPYQPYGGLKGA